MPITGVPKPGRGLTGDGPRRPDTRGATSDGDSSAEPNDGTRSNARCQCFPANRSSPSIHLRLHRGAYHKTIAARGAPFYRTGNRGHPCARTRPAVGIPCPASPPPLPGLASVSQHPRTRRRFAAPNPRRVAQRRPGWPHDGTGCHRLQAERYATPAHAAPDPPACRRPPAHVTHKASIKPRMARPATVASIRRAVFPAPDRSARTPG